MDAKLDFILRNGIWRWKPAHSDALVEIQSRLLEVHLGLTDKPIWQLAGMVLTLVLILGIFREGRRMLWIGGIWVGFLIPFQSRLFSFCLLCTTRLSTSDLLLTWGYTGDAKCVFFFRSVIESRDHLFFSCSFNSSSRIWKTCMQMCYPFVLSTDWHAVISEGCTTDGKQRL